MKDFGTFRFSIANDYVPEILYWSRNHERLVFTKGHNWFLLIHNVFGFKFSYLKFNKNFNVLLFSE